MDCECKYGIFRRNFDETCYTKGIHLPTALESMEHPTDSLLSKVVNFNILIRINVDGIYLPFELTLPTANKLQKVDPA